MAVTNIVYEVKRYRTKGRKKVCTALKRVEADGSFARELRG